MIGDWRVTITNDLSLQSSSDCVACFSLEFLIQLKRSPLFSWGSCFSTGNRHFWSGYLFQQVLGVSKRKKIWVDVGRLPDCQQVKCSHVPFLFNFGLCLVGFWGTETASIKHVQILATFYQTLNWNPAHRQPKDRYLGLKTGVGVGGGRVSVKLPLCPAHRVCRIGY